MKKKTPKNYRLSSETIENLKKLKRKIALQDYTETKIVEKAIETMAKTWALQPEIQDQTKI